MPGIAARDWQLVCVVCLFFMHSSCLQAGPVRVVCTPSAFLLRLTICLLFAPGMHAVQHFVSSPSHHLCAFCTGHAYCSALCPLTICVLSALGMHTAQHFVPPLPSVCSLPWAYSQAQQLAAKKEEQGMAHGEMDVNIEEGEHDQYFVEVGHEQQFASCQQ